MGDTFRLGRIAGIRVGLNWSVLVLMAIIIWSLSANVFPDSNPDLDQNVYFAMAVVTAALFFGSILAHELGHAILARREGMEIDGITLWALGGVARFSGNFPSAGAEFRIAIAGPIVSAFLAAGFIGLSLVPSLPGAVHGTVTWLGLINLLLLGFNMIPALPLDGGRVLRSALWAWRGDMVGATRIAGGAGRVFAYAMMAAGGAMVLFVGALDGLWLVVLGWFLGGAATAETRAAATQATFSDVRVRDVMIEQPVTASPDETLADLHAAIVWGPQFTSYPVVDRGRAVGLLPAQRFSEAPQAQWATKSVAECMVPIERVPTFALDDPALDAMWRLRSGIGRGLVIDSEERMVGLLSITDIARTLRVRQSLAQER